MRFKLGLAIGFAAGYYLGAKAGRARYEQLRQWVDKAKESEAVEVAAEKAKAVVDLGVERARDVVEHFSHGEGDTAEDVAVTTPAGGNGADRTERTDRPAPS